MWISVRHNILEYLLRVSMRQLSWSQLWKLFKAFLAYIGTFFALTKVIDLSASANPNSEFCKYLKDNVGGDWFNYIIVILVIISFISVFKRIKTEYKLKSHDVKIIFDYCDVIAGSGHRVIEISNTICLDPKKIGNTNDLTYFKEKYKKTNGSLDLGEIIRNSFKDLGFTLQKQGRGKKPTYTLGTFGEVVFNEDKYIFATSINRTSTGDNITKDEDFTKFLAQFWVNMSNQNWKNDIVRIPVFCGAGGYTINSKMRIYQIVLTFISNVKDGRIPCKELRICINNDKENSKDLDSYKAMAQFIDEFATASMPGGKRVGSVLDVAGEAVEAANGEKGA